MTEHLTKRLIDHRGISLAPQRVAKLALEHAEGGFHVAALVIVLQELFPLELEVVENLLPEDRGFARCVSPEQNVAFGETTLVLPD